MPPKARDHFQPPPPAQALAELKNLVARAKPDFKGNLGPQVKVKTQVDYKKEAAERLSKFPDQEEFKFSYKLKQPMGFVATKGSKVRPQSARAAAREDATHRREVQLANDPHYGADIGNCHPNHNPYHQQLDRGTGRPQLETVLHWDEGGENSAPADGKLIHDGKRTGRRVFSEKYLSDLDKIGTPGNEIGLNPGGRATRQDVEDLTPRHRTALIRALTMAHPKYTKESMIARPQHWEPMSQLITQQYAEDARIAAEIKKRKREEAAAKAKPDAARARNSVRMVAMMRQAQGKSQTAWH